MTTITGQTNAYLGPYSRLSMDDYDKTKDVDQFTFCDALAGRLTRQGYISVNHLGKTMAAHRLVWLLRKGNWPTQQIDHINGIPSDNRIENLRLCTPSQNSANKKPTIGKYKGVTFHKQSGKYQASIAKNYIGLYALAVDAALAYDREANHRYGEFVKTNFGALS